jgi:hypothetical protein
VIGGKKMATQDFGFLAPCMGFILYYTNFEEDQIQNNFLLCHYTVLNPARDINRVNPSISNFGHIKSIRRMMISHILIHQVHKFTLLTKHVRNHLCVFAVIRSSLCRSRPEFGTITKYGRPTVCAAQMRLEVFKLCM